MAQLFMDFTPLKVSLEYRRIWYGNLFSTLSFFTTSTAIALNIFALTSSTAAVGLTGIVALLPLTLGGLYGGVIADSYDRRKVALGATLGAWVNGLLLAGQAWLGGNNVYLLCAYIFIQSLLHPLNMAARAAIIPRLVGQELLPAANALGMIVGTLGMSLGPMLAGLLLTSIGYQWIYSLNIFALLVGIWALYKLPAIPPEEEEETNKDQAQGIGPVLEGLGYLTKVPVVGMTFLVDIIGMILVQARPLIPALVLVSFGGGDTAAGILLAAPAIGAFLGAAFSGWIKKIKARGRLVVLSYIGWGLGFMIFGLVGLAYLQHKPSDPLPAQLPALALGCLGLALAGWADSVGSILRTTILQTAVPDRLRGRMQGLFILTVTGGPNLGAAVSGFIAQLIGSAQAALLGGLACILAITLFTLLAPSLWRYRLEQESS